MGRDMQVTRRGLVRGTAAGAAALAASGGIAEMVAARKAPAVIQDNGTFTYWGGLIFSDEANELLQTTIEAWCEENGFEPDVVMINQNETVQRVSAAVEAGTMPDALDLGLDLLLQLTQSEQVMPLDELYDRIGEAHGGWFPSVDDALSPDRFNGARMGIPFGASGNILFRRVDALEAAGLTEAPATWAEMVDQARAAQTPPALFGLGIALSNVGDANTMISVLHSYGGRIADDAGTTPMLDSPETREFLDLIISAWDDDLFSPGNTTWDGAGDNVAYESGQAIFILNTGSVHINLLNIDPELEELTGYSPLPAGPEGTFSPINPNVRAIPVTSGNAEAAQSLFERLAEPDFAEQYYNVAIYGPALQDQRDFDIFSTEVHGALLGLVESGTAPGAPDVFNAAYSEMSTTFVIPRMIQRIVVDGASVDDSIATAMTELSDIYEG